MNERWWGVLALAVAFGAFLAWRRRREDPASDRDHVRTEAQRRRGREAGRAVRGDDDDDADIDRETLEEAEREVRDLETDAKGRPLDDVVGDDWGPGVPKPPYV